MNALYIFSEETEIRDQFYINCITILRAKTINLVLWISHCFLPISDHSYFYPYLDAVLERKCKRI